MPTPSWDRGSTRAWRTLRATALARDNHRCQCGAPAEQVDHIRPRHQGGTDDLDNLRSLCAPCHQAKSAREGRARAAAARHPTERHPGARQ